MINLHILRSFVKDNISVMSTTSRLNKDDVSSRVFCEKIVVFRMSERRPCFVIADDDQGGIRFCVRQMIQCFHPNIIIYNNNFALCFPVDFLIGNIRFKRFSV